MPDGVWDREVDLLVAGAGPGGMTAALVAALEGLDVLICEKSEQVGGTGATSAGTLWIPENSQSRDAGYNDTADDAGAYLDAAVLRAGVRSTLTLLNTGLNSNVALALNQAEGRVRLNIEPVRIMVRLVVDRRTCRVKRWRVRCSWKELGGVTVLNYSRGTTTRTLFSL